MAKKKEVHFFDHDNYFANDKADYEAYHSFFAPLPSHRLLGETTPAYGNTILGNRASNKAHAADAQSLVLNCGDSALARRIVDETN